jgi:esterase/lipase superfamily enzyme
MVGALADFIDAGKLKLFTVNSINGLSFYNKGAHPFHRSYVQSMFDSYLREEVVPFIWDNCQSPGIAISTMGASFGAYHAANSLFKHPDVIKRCFAMSGVYDLKNFMDGMFDENFYFNNPVDYICNLSDSRLYDQLSSCDIHLTTGTGQWENSGPTYHFSGFWRTRVFAIRWTIGAIWAATLAVLEAPDARLRAQLFLSVIAEACLNLTPGACRRKSSNSCTQNKFSPG